MAIAARNVPSGTQSRIIAIDDSKQILRVTRRELRRTNLKDKITLLAGNITEPSFYSGLLSELGSTRSTFHIIFAGNILTLIPAEKHVAVLQQWATYLTPDSGRVVFTLGVYTNLSMKAPCQGGICQDETSILFKNAGRERGFCTTVQ